MNMGYGLGLQPQSHHFTITDQLRLETNPDLWHNSTSFVDMSGHNVVWTHPYAHPQHIMVVKYLIYI